MEQITLNDLISQEMKRNPSSLYDRIRAQEPLAYLMVNGMGFWVATTYEDAVAILKDPRFIKDRQKLMSPEETQQSAEARSSHYEPLAWRRDMLMVDPPDHTRLRRLVSKAFTPRMIEQLHPRIQQITDELLEAFAGRGTVDLIANFAFPLPIMVISEMLGIPSADRQQFRAWIQTIAKAAIDPGQAAKGIAAEEAFLHYIQMLIAQKRDHPTQDLISGLVQAEEQGDTLSEEELISTIFLLIVAGHETTVNLLGNGVLALLEHPDQLDRLRAEPALISSTIEELLRYTPPVMNSILWASEDIPMHGKVIRKGEVVQACLVAANMDAQQFADPHQLDITRQENQHLAFGKGIHYCLGAPLARLEGHIAISTLLRRLPHLRLACEPEQLVWNMTPANHRGLASLPVLF